MQSYKCGNCNKNGNFRQKQENKNEWEFIPRFCPLRVCRTTSRFISETRGRIPATGQPFKHLKTKIKAQGANEGEAGEICWHFWEPVKRRAAAFCIICRRASRNQHLYTRRYNNPTWKRWMRISKWCTERADIIFDSSFGCKKLALTTALNHFHDHFYTQVGNQGLTKGVKGTSLPNLLGPISRTSGNLLTSRIGLH